MGWAMGFEPIANLLSPVESVGLTPRKSWIGDAQKGVLRPTCAQILGWTPCSETKSLGNFAKCDLPRILTQQRSWIREAVTCPAFWDSSEVESGKPTTLAGSYRAELHPTGGGTGKDHQAHQLARIPAHIFNTSRWERWGCEDGAVTDATANSNITMNIYTHAVTSKKRRAQSKVVGMILPAEKATTASAGVA
jgi:hypothetical protein